MILFLSANSNHELGRGNKVGGWRPQPIHSLEDVRVIQIASGGYHSLALTGIMTAKSMIAPAIVEAYFYLSFENYVIFSVVHDIINIR